MNWRWAPQVFAAMHQGDLVILDARANAYMVLAQAEDRLRLSADGAEASLIDAGLGDELQAAGLGAVGVAAGAAERRRLPSANADLDMVAELDDLGTSDLWSLLAAATTLIWTFWLAPFGRLVRPIAATAAEDPLADRRVVRSALAFRRLLVWIPFQGRCLYRAALLRRYLGADAARVTWVFGVSTWPFDAHCWLQCGELVLNDRLHRVRRYTPIMAV
jgi:hypothetical protein